MLPTSPSPPCGLTYWPATALRRQCSGSTWVVVLVSCRHITVCRKSGSATMRRQRAPEACCTICKTCRSGVGLAEPAMRLSRAALNPAGTAARRCRRSDACRVAGSVVEPGDWPTALGAGCAGVERVEHCDRAVGIVGRVDLLPGGQRRQRPVRRAHPL